MQDTLAACGVDAVTGGTLRRDQGDRARFVRSVAELFVRGVALDAATIVPAGPALSGLPTTAFRREHYWLLPETVSDAAGLGQGAVDHPLLGAVVETATGGGILLTGLLSHRAQPWLADEPLVPASTLAELAIRAG